MTKQTKKMKSFREKIDRTKEYDLEEAVKTLKGFAKDRKFDETFEIAFNLNIDPRHADQSVRGMIALPQGTGQSATVAVFAKDAKAEEAKEAGADFVGAEDLAEKIQNGDIDFDRCIATPDMMPLVGRLGKVLGPKGLMPNPKLGTVTPDVAKAVKDAKGGSIEYRAEKNGIVHVGIGKASFSEKDIAINARAMAEAIMKAKPSGAKGSYVGKITLTTTMGPGLKLDLDSLLTAPEEKEAA